MINNKQIADYIFKHMSQEEAQRFEELLDNNSIYADSIEGALNLCAEKNITSRKDLIVFLNQIDSSKIESPELIVSKNGNHRKGNSKKSVSTRYVMGIAASLLIIISLWIILNPGRTPLDSMIAELHINEPEPIGLKSIRGANPDNSGFNQSMISAIKNLEIQKFTTALTTFNEYCSSSEGMEKEFACFYAAYIHYKTEDWESAKASMNNFIQAFSNSEYSNDIKAEFYLGRIFFELSNHSDSPENATYLSKSLKSYQKVKNSDLLIGRQISNEMLEALNTRILNFDESI